MKFIVLVLVLLVSCASPVMTCTTYDAVWRGDEIVLQTSHLPMVFRAPRSSASDEVSVPVKITQVDGKWYIYANGLQQEIFPL
jgi:uncharacterized lipoprotein YmbA